MKDSGVEWLGEIPADWDVESLKWVFLERNTKASLGDVHLTPSQKYGTLPQEDYIKVSGSRPVLALSESANFKSVKTGDFISHLRSFQGGLEITRYDGKMSSAYSAISPTNLTHSEYYKYVFKSDLFIQLLNSTTAQMRDGQSIRWPILKNLRIPLPPLSTQRRIAAFLDERTANIDALVAELSGFSETLKLQRKALINECVTKGVPGERNREMKDSGVEWLGEIPAGWHLEKLKTLFSNHSEMADPADIHLTPSRKYGTLPQADYIEISGMRPQLVLSQDAKFKKVAYGDFISHLGSHQGGLEISYYEGKMSQAYTAITPLEKVRGEFFKYLFKCESFIHLLDSTTSQLRNGQSIRWKDLRNVSLPLPPLAEQSKIASFLDDQCGRIDELLSEINTQINLLRQYRKSLISEAVTGKIEV